MKTAKALGLNVPPTADEVIEAPLCGFPLADPVQIAAREPCRKVFFSVAFGAFLHGQYASKHPENCLSGH